MHIEAIKQAMKHMKDAKLKCLLGVSGAFGNIGVMRLQNSGTNKENDDAAYSLSDDEELPPILDVADRIHLKGNISNKIAERIADEALNKNKEENKNFLESREESEEWMRRQMRYEYDHYSVTLHSIMVGPNSSRSFNIANKL